MDGSESGAQASTTIQWGYTAWGELRYKVDGYLTSCLPPADRTTAVRAVLLDGRQVLLCQTLDGPHVWPGGGPEPGEDPVVTVIRELREETGWQVEVGPRLGYLHLRHLQPEPPDYTYPYPDFFQLVHVARPTEHLSGQAWDDVEGWEHDSRFVDIGGLPVLDEVQRLFLSAAVEATRAWPGSDPSIPQQGR